MLMCLISNLYGFVIHNTIHPFYIPIILHRVAYPREPRAQGWGHPGWGASPLLVTIAHTFTHYGRFESESE